ncbi:hypothetical protein MBEHAL_0806 [Halarchaeum acidiphilum MH1-52-1]|uniref:MrfA-like Zn-binding domain-containing protein n=1 Tax=Halarchaeum acidiphilum MH1-52-1 TaxID=1261545 RepID=U2YE78_9EURY|nr:DUF1998 domain-containing protein [Halarchaeum acidiphilum]GAD52046.1 hypothetical protein MBEHAL_0806 [Halarchaeum acidiphilum MH1-52-1]
MSYENAEMERGVAQVLANFVPGDLFDYARYGITMMVDEWQHQEMDVDQRRIANHVQGRVSSFPNGNRPPWSELDDAQIDVFRPQKVYGEIFPTTLVCKRCDHVEYRNTSKGLQYTNGRCTRSGCNGDLQQVSFVATHDCGEVFTLKPSGCGAHDHQDIRLNRGVPEDMRTWSFECGICHQRTGDLSAYCDRCDEWVQSIQPTNAGSVFYPQREVIVDIPHVDVDEDAIPYGEEWTRILMAAHLDDVDLEESGVTLEDIATSTQSEEDVLEDLYEQFGREWVEENKEQALQIAMGNSPTKGTVVAQNRDRVELPAEHRGEDVGSAYTVVAHELFTFLRSTRGYEGGSMRENVEDRHPTPRPLSTFVDDDEFVEKYPQSKLYREKLDRVNVTDAWIVDNFPLLNTVFGYTRDSPDASETTLRAFDHPWGLDALTVWGDRSPSEAIVLELDRGAIVEWLVENDYLDSSEAPDTDDDTELKRWFLNNFDATQTQNPFAPIEDELTNIVYRLVHSSSHALMNTASEQCGLDTDSISELLLPTVPAIVLYAQSMEHFALGGMFTLFKTRLHPWIDDAVDHASQCIYDPACLEDDEGAACHACLHVSEFTCEYYNGALDRELLVGGDEHTPFWDVQR